MRLRDHIAQVGLAVLLSGCASQPAYQPASGAFIWVNRWDFQTAGDLPRIMRNCAAAGASDVLVQVRGNGTAHYASALEPRSARYAAGSADPLAAAVSAGHRQGLRVHAWINLMPGWSGKKPPKDQRQLYRQHPEWFLRRPGSREVAGEGNYLWLDPRLPAVRRHLVAICAELARRYEIDGLHLDYVRMPDGAGAFPGAAQAITELVGQIRSSLRQHAPRCRLTAAVIGDLAKAQQRLAQDWPVWARNRQVDAVFPMLYRLSDGLFAARVRACVRAAGRTPVVAGIGAHWHTAPADSLRQMDAGLREGAAGAAVYGYAKASKPAWRAALADWSGR